jgi:hypothetical protein
MAAKETGKQRAARISMDYYKDPDWIQGIKGALAVLAVLGASVWLVCGIVLPGEVGQKPYSRGPVAAVHTKWDSDCTQCHTPFRPLASENFLNGTLVSLHGSDEKCETCHAAPVHRKSQKMEDTPSCAGCHRDHRGLNASLIRTDDAQCTSCHANVTLHMKSGEEPQFPDATKITSFTAQDHPEFRLFRKQEADPGSVKFNHELHMKPGQVLAEGGRAFTLEDIVEGERDRYKKMLGISDPTAAVQLNCESCHQVVAEQKPPRPEYKDTRLSLVRDYSGYMKPVTYDNACAACHPLTLPYLKEKLPHGKQPKEYLDILASRNPTLPKEQPARRTPPPLPGSSLASASEATPASNRTEQWQREAVLLLFRGKTTCGECHNSSVRFPDVAQPDVRSAIVQFDQAPKIPSLWFKHARFDHNAHGKGVADCKDCHAKAYTSAHSSDILIPKQENCLNCHSPTASGPHRGRSDCAECHYFHGADENAERVLTIRGP